MLDKTDLVYRNTLKWFLNTTGLTLIQLFHNIDNKIITVNEQRIKITKRNNSYNIKFYRLTPSKYSNV